MTTDVCLVVVAFNVHSDFPLVVAANRDEFHARPTQNAAWWTDQPDILAGRDLQAGGTWLGLHRSGRFATITNFRDAKTGGARLRSRGHLVTEFLLSDQPPLEYLLSVAPGDYDGFNLLVADGEHLAYLSNRGGGARELPPGVYGLSNATLNTPWEKVERSKSRLVEILEQDAVDDTHLLRLLGDREKGPPSEVKSDRLPFATAHAITAPFIVTPEYGTRCSSVVRAGNDGHWQLLEQRFNPAGDKTGESQFSFHSGEYRQ